MVYLSITEMCQIVDGKYIPVNDGAKIYYENPVGKDNFDKKELLDLFLQRDVFNSKKFPNLSNEIKYFKYVEERAKEREKEFAKYFILEGKDTEVTHLSIEEVETLRD